MENTRRDRPIERRYRVKPLRLAASVLLFCLVVGAVFVLPRNLGFLLRVPCASPLGIGGEAGFGEVATLPYAGRCLAMRVAADGTALAAAIDGDGLSIYAAFADGSHLNAQCSLSGEVGPVAFLPSGHLVVWTTERSGGGGGTVQGFGPITKSALARSPLSAVWTCRLDKSGVAMLALPDGVGALYASGDGVPAGCVIISASGKKGASIELADGIHTAWDVASVSGQIGLAGASYTVEKPYLSTFVQTYLANGSRVMSTATAGSPALRLAASATGSHLLYATQDRLVMINNKGEPVWSRFIPGDAVRGLHVFPDGRAFLAGPDAGISLDDRGRVVQRWSLTGSGQVSRPGPAESVILSLPGGAVAIDSTGRVLARALWEGPSQLIAADSLAQWLFRADGAALTLYRRG